MFNSLPDMEKGLTFLALWFFVTGSLVLIGILYGIFWLFKHVSITIN